MEKFIKFFSSPSLPGTLTPYTAQSATKSRTVIKFVTSSVEVFSPRHLKLIDEILSFWFNLKPVCISKSIHESEPVFFIVN